MSLSSRSAIMGCLSRYRLICTCVLSAILVLGLATVNYKLRTGTSVRYRHLLPDEYSVSCQTVDGVKSLVNSSVVVARLNKPSMSPLLPKKFMPLSEEAVNEVKKFVFFFGSGASGSSAIGNLMDAHPHMIIPHEYGLFEKWAADSKKYHHRKRYIFNELYEFSYNGAASGDRKKGSACSKRGYTFNVDGSWQGQYKDSLIVIGDKKADATPELYKANPARFQQIYRQLAETVEIPLLALLPVRNPFDIVAKVVLQVIAHTQNMRELRASHRVYKNDNQLKHTSRDVLQKAAVTHAMIHDPKLNFTILEIHNADYVKYPKKTVQRICDFVEVECSEEYLQACEDKAFKSTFKTRELLDWPPELINQMEQEMRKYKFFERYSFESE